MVTINISSIPDLCALEAFDLTRAEMEGRRRRMSMSGLPEYLPDSRVLTFAPCPQVGIRETRRIAGEYVLQEEDVLKGRKFNDG